MLCGPWLTQAACQTIALMFGSICFASTPSRARVHGLRKMVWSWLVWALLAPSAWAQFERSAWPPSQATPVWQAPDIQGRAWRSDALKGRVVVLNFWATWCAPCKEELPTLQTLSDFVDPQQVVVLALNVKEPASRVHRYAQSTGLDMPVLLDPKGEVAQLFGVKVFPTTILLDRQGRARWRIVGEVDWHSAPAQQWVQELQPR